MDYSSLHKVFGIKENEKYHNRTGAYLIPVKSHKIGVIKTPKGFFLLGGGVNGNETHEQCIKRECLEEIGCNVTVKEKICSAEAYCIHSEIGRFHPIQAYYLGDVSKRVQQPTESDHDFLWIDYQTAKEKMFSEMQGWAIEQAIRIIEGRCQHSISFKIRI